MAQCFFINRNSELPTLRMEIINDGKNDFGKFFLAIQNADITFSMWNEETGVYKIAKAPAYVVYDEDSECEERYMIEYRWKKRDTNEAGRFIGQFNIKLNGDAIYMDGVSFPTGNLIVPISEDLYITVNDGTLKRQ